MDSVGEESPGVQPTGLSKLPEELCLHIASRLAGKRDLAQLCLVNKLGRKFAAQELYRAISVTLCEQNDDHLLAELLRNSNPNVNHIRDVCVCFEQRYSTLPQTLLDQLRRLIDALPQNQLKSWHWGTPVNLPASIYEALWRTHTSLQRLEVCPVASVPPGLVGIEEIDLSKVLRGHVEHCSAITSDDAMGIRGRKFSNLKAIRAVVDILDTARLTNRALQCGAIDQLELDARFWRGGDVRHAQLDPLIEDEDEELHRVNDLLIETVLGHLERSKPGCLAKHDSITNLILKDVDMTFCKHSLLTFLELSTLKNLKLEHCKGADLFLIRVFSGMAANPALKSFTLVHDSGEHGDRIVHAIDGVLEFPGNTIRHIELSLRNASALPDPTGLVDQERSLQTLLLDIMGKPIAECSDTSNGWGSPTTVRAKHLLYNAKQIKTVAYGSTSLIELAIALPDFHLEYDQFSDNYDFVDHLKKLTHALPELATLKILNWPTSYAYGDKKGYYKAMNLQLSPLANDVFLRHQPHLEVIAFGRNEASEGSIPQPAYFVRSEVSMLGQVRAGVAGVSLLELMNFGMSTAVLEHERNFDERSPRSRVWSEAYEGWNH